MWLCFCLIFGFSAVGTLACDGWELDPASTNISQCDFSDGDFLNYGEVVLNLTKDCRMVAKGLNNFTMEVKSVALNITASIKNSSYDMFYTNLCETLGGNCGNLTKTVELWNPMLKNNQNYSENIEDMLPDAFRVVIIYSDINYNPNNWDCMLVEGKILESEKKF